jgi:hypothetical protein
MIASRPQDRCHSDVVVPTNPCIEDVARASERALCRHQPLFRSRSKHVVVSAAFVYQACNSTIERAPLQYDLTPQPK